MQTLQGVTGVLFQNAVWELVAGDVLRKPEDHVATH